MSWADKVGTEPMMAVNLGTRGLQESRPGLRTMKDLPVPSYYSGR